jgi:hypothetical protein
MDRLKLFASIALLLCVFSFSGDDGALQVSKINVLYMGLDNPISISHPRIKCENLIVKLEPESLATLEQTGCGEYKVKLKKRDRKGINIVVYKKREKDKNLLAKMNFRTLKVPSPVASIGGHTEGTISVQELASVTEVNVDLPNFSYEGIQYEITGFDFIYKPVEGNLIRATTTSSNFPNVALEKFNAAQKEDLLIVSGIYANAPGLGKMPLAGSIVLNVID